MSFNVFGLSFHLYGLFLGLGILAAFEASLQLAKVRKIEKKVIEELFVWVVIGGIVGARIYHVIDKWKEIYSLNYQSIFYIWNGGLGIWGGIMGGLIGFCLSLLIYHCSFNFDLLDVVIFGVPLGQAIGRWGNFFNNEIVGKNGEPLFLYESVLDLFLFGILVLIAKKDSSKILGMTKRGRITGVYLVGYGLIRLILEPLRPESIVWKIGSLPTASLFSVIAIVIGGCLIFRRRF